ncbi:MAG: CCA tRNA nucleotidyltransferase [Solirubrobacteraceae bacterium]
MDVPPPNDLLAAVRSLPAAPALLDHVTDAVPVYLVGGAVRDLLLGGRPLDLDLVVEGDPARVAAALGGEVRSHDRFGTSTVSLDGFTYDLARSRRETYAHPGALPDVSPAPLSEDLLRRDFTVNALAIALVGPAAGSLEAAPLGLDDLKRRTLRVLHDASFIDDPTRALRLARYASRLEFEIEPHTRALLDSALDAGAISTVSGSRIGAELRLLAREQDPISAFRCLGELGIAHAVHPALGLDDEPLARRALALLPNDGRRDRLALALAARHVPPPELAYLLHTLAFEAPDRHAILAAATKSPALARDLERAGRPSEIADAVADAGPELVALAGALGPERQAREWLAKLRHVRLEIGGNDLIEACVREGPAIGVGLHAALSAKLDGRVSGREAELREALQAARDSG